MISVVGCPEALKLLGSLLWCSQRNTKYPDFKHSRPGDALWMDGWSKPPWMNSKLIVIANGGTQPEDGFNFQVHAGARSEDWRYYFVDDDLWI